MQDKNKELSEEEKEKARMRRLSSLRKVATCILAKWSLPLALLFLASMAGLGAFSAAKASKSVKRYEAQTRLLYSPKKHERVSNVSDWQLMAILKSARFKRLVGDKVDMPQKERECLAADMEIKQEKKPTNIFTLKAASQSWKGAVLKANAYAETLIDAYVDDRTRELDRTREAVLASRAALVDELSEIEAEASTLKTRTGILSPQEALLAANTLLSDLRRNDSSLGVDIKNEEVKRRKMEKSTGGAGAAIAANAQAIRKRMESIAAVDNEISTLREKYTDLNPKVAGKLAERAEKSDELREFLKSKGVGEVSIENIDQIEKDAAALADCITRIEALAEKRRALEQEINDKAKEAAQLAMLIPEYEKLQTRRAGVSSAIRDLDREIEDISYMQSSVRNDLRQIDRAGGAGDNGPFGAKQIAISAGGSLFFTGFAAVAILFLEFMFGKVRGGREVAAYPELGFVGSLPAKGQMPDADLHEVTGVVALKIFLSRAHSGSVLICRLPGAEPPEEFSGAIDFTASMSGVSMFTLDIVSGRSFTPPEDSEQMIGVSRKGSRGWFPAANRFALSPSELQILQADIATLRETHETVFIRMEGGIRTGGTFIDQLQGISDALLLEVGYDTTPRRVFNYMRRHVGDGGNAISLVTGAPAKVVRRELEEKA